MPSKASRKKRHREVIDGAGDVAPNSPPPHRASTAPFNRDKDIILEMCRDENKELISELKVNGYVCLSCILAFHLIIVLYFEFIEIRRFAAVLFRIHIGRAERNVGLPPLVRDRKLSCGI